MSGSDSGVEIPASPGEGMKVYGINRDTHDSIILESMKPSFGSLPKVKTKDDLLKMLKTIRTEETKSPEMEIEDWN